MVDKDAILTELHDLVGLCNHCGKMGCPGKKSGSRLPQAIHVDNVIAAIDNAFAKYESTETRRHER